MRTSSILRMPTEIKLSNSPLTTTVDDDIPAIIGHHPVSLNRAGYAQLCIQGASTLLHHLILKPQPGENIDHIDRNRLNNLRSNLRIVTPQENQLHRERTNFLSQYRGITRDKYSYIARTNINGEIKATYHKSEIEAARAWDDRMSKAKGAEWEFLNFKN